MDVSSNRRHACLLSRWNGETRRHTERPRPSGEGGGGLCLEFVLHQHCDVAGTVKHADDFNALFDGAVENQRVGKASNRPDVNSSAEVVVVVPKEASVGPFGEKLEGVLNGIEETRRDRLALPGEVDQLLVDVAVGSPTDECRGDSRRRLWGD